MSRRTVALEARPPSNKKSAGESRRVTVRLDGKLLDAARRKSGLKSDSEVIRYALAQLADTDNYWAWLTGPEGPRLDKDFEFEF
jgi:hypothetical protein